MTRRDAAVEKWRQIQHVIEPKAQRRACQGDAVGDGGKAAAKPEATANEPGAFRQKLAGYGLNTNPEPEILWNFEKFVIDRSGRVVARFSPELTPDDPLVAAAIEAALKQ